MHRWSRLPAPAVALFLAVVAAPHPAAAAPPRLIVIHGPPLAQPVVLSDRRANLRLIQGPETDARPEDLAERPFYELAFFWGNGQVVSHRFPLERIDEAFRQAEWVGRQGEQTAITRVVLVP